jgi:hypothetical protein
MRKSLFVSVQNKTSTQGTDLLGERSVHRAALSERKPTQKTKTKIKTEPNRTQIERKPEMRAHNNTLQKKRKQEKEVHSAIYIPRRFNYWVLASSGFFDNAFCHYFYSPKQRYSTADRYSRRLVLHHTQTHKSES